MLGFVATAATTKSSSPLRFLVFGDSQGDTGPTWRALDDSLKANKISATVINKSVGGTLACGWAQDPDAIVKAANDAFGGAPDFVWYTAGGNDLAGDEKYHTCLDAARSLDAAKACVDGGVSRLMPCTTTLLQHLWTAFPSAKVGQYNYMDTCMDGDCQSASAEFLGGSYCTSGRFKGAPSECMLTLLAYWQTIMVDALQATYPKPQYTGMNVLGAVQAASGVPGASVGHLNVTGGGAKCEWMTYCVHPTYGTPTADAIGKAFWDQWVGPIVGASAEAVEQA